MDPLFHWFQIFLTPHFRKTLDPIESNLFSHAESSYQTFGEVPPHDGISQVCIK